MAYEHLPEDARALIGKEFGPYPCPVSVDRSIIDHWIEVYEDCNPLYSNDEYAKTSKHQGIIAPPGLLLSWTIPYYWRPKEGRVDRSKGQITFEMKKILDCPIGALSETIAEWYKPIKLGDKLTWSEVIMDVSQRKQTRLGSGHFWTVETRIRNEQGELVGALRWTSFNYKGEQA